VVKPFFVRPSFKQLKDWKRKEEIIRQNIELHSHQFKSSKEKKNLSASLFATVEL